MAPCEVEIRVPGSEKWIKVGRVGPGDQPGSLSSVREDGVREMILFECAEDDSETKIFRSGLEIDWEAKGSKRVVSYLEFLELVETLKKGESFEINITTDRGTRAIMRFTHQ